MPDAPQRGFAPEEFANRLARAQQAMSAHQLDAVVVTTAQNIRYFTGLSTTFWESPTRPWFVVVPRSGDLVAVIPDIGAAGMAMTWVEDIRTWPAPQPEDDGLSLLNAVLQEIPRTSGAVGWEMGRESIVRMPLVDFDRLRATASGLPFVDGAPLLWQLRMVKSEAEIARIQQACAIACDAFDALLPQLTAGQTDYEVAALFRAEAITRGADTVPFLSVCAGAGGYEQIIAGPVGHTLADGDVLFVDMGVTYDGYFSDFDRNVVFGSPDVALERAHTTLWRATEAGIAAARPGATTDDLFDAMARVIADAGYDVPTTGRLGHGLGLHLTEPPSHRPGDETELVAGMVLTIEPGLTYAPGKMLVHEEDIVVRADGATCLTRRAPETLPVIG